jgi:hypothetical protein
VRDPSGAAIPGANVELRQDQHPLTIFTIQSGREGEFKFTALPSGTYTLRITTPGFRWLTVRSVQIEPREGKVLPGLRLDAGGDDLRGPAVDQLQLLPNASNRGNLSGRVIRDASHAVGQVAVELLCNEPTGWR